MPDTGVAGVAAEAGQGGGGGGSSSSSIPAGMLPQECLVVGNPCPVVLREEMCFGERMLTYADVC
jgi:hypothetical protein